MMNHEPKSDKRVRRRRRRVRLEMTSLMDVMFLVLVFFIYCIFNMSVHKGLKVDLPKANGAYEKGERIIVTVKNADSMELNGILLSKEEIVERVRQLYSNKISLPVLISGDKASSLGVGIELLSDLKDVGVEKIAFQVEGEKSAGR